MFRARQNAATSETRSRASSDGESVCKIDAVIPEMDFKDVSNLHKDPSLRLSISSSSPSLPFFLNLAEPSEKVTEVKYCNAR